MNSIDNNQYSLVDKNILEYYCKDSNIKNLVHLSNDANICIFNKKNKKWCLKSNDKLIKECENIKKKEIKNSSSLLSNLAKLNSNNTTDTTSIQSIYKNLENKIKKVDDIIECINNIKTKKNNTNIIDFNEIKIVDKVDNVIKIDINNIIKKNRDYDYIECYSNC
jgi:predicted ATPase